MNNKEFIAELAARSGYTQNNAQRLVKGVVEAMGKSFENSEPVQLFGFGTFEVKKRLERTMMNPVTGQKMLIPPKLVLTFKSAYNIKQILKNGGQSNG